MPPPSIQCHRRRRWWRLVAVLLRWGRDAEERAQEGVQALGELARAAEARGDDHAGEVLLGALQRVVDHAEGQVDDVLVHSARYNPVYEQRLDVERVNDVRQLRPDGGQVFFLSHVPNSHRKLGARQELSTDERARHG